MGSLSAVLVLGFAVGLLLVSVSAARYGPVCDPDCGNIIFDCGLRPPFSFSCPNGFEKDSCGCQTSCDCAGCPKFDKSIACNLGRKTDRNGCPTDECICPDRCQVADCLLRPIDLQYTCPTTNRLDGCGCVYSCQCAGCPDFDLNLSCPNGKRMDANGCPLSICECPAVNTCELQQPDLLITCPNGNRLDSNGCVENCQCAGCTDVDLTISCINGRRMDSNGCPTNQCQSTCTICAPNECELRPPEFRINCPNGNRLDECGCVSSCQCANCPDIDRNKACTYGRVSGARGCPTDTCNPPPTPIVKPGSCPQYGVWGRTSCEKDADCPGNEKCCETRLRSSTRTSKKVCITPSYVRSTNRGSY